MNVLERYICIGDNTRGLWWGPATMLSAGETGTLNTHRWSERAFEVHGIYLEGQLEEGSNVQVWFGKYNRLVKSRP